MNPNDAPELIDWHDQVPPNNRNIGLFPAAILGSLLFTNAFGYSYCYPEQHYRIQDYYTCTPKYICKPVPYWPGL